MIKQASRATNRPLERKSLWSRIQSSPDFLILASFFVGSMVLHLTTAARTVTYSDSGDFLMAIATVGNCHGPGYPLYLMTAKIFTWIFPFGSLAFRVSVLSGIFASLAGCLIYWVVFRMTRSRIGGAVAAIAFIFSYTFWYETVIPETYGLNVFFFALLLILMLRWERQLKEGHRKKADNTLAIFALTFGLAMTNHFSAVFLLPAFVFFALDTGWREVFALRNILRMAAFFLVGLLPYVYVPTAAFRGPAYNYGDPSTLAGWYRHITLYYLRGGLFNYPLRFFPARFWRFFQTLTTEFPYVFWLAAVGVLASFLRKSKKYALFMVLFFLFSAVAVMTYDQIESVLRAHFYYPAYLAVAIWIGFGAAWIARLVKQWADKRDRLVSATALALTAMILIVAVCLSIPAHYGKVDKSRYFYARDMALKMLAKAGPDGIILIDNDNVIFPLKYMQTVEGVGTRVRAINPRAIGVPGWTASDLDQGILVPGDEVKSTDALYAKIAKNNYRQVPVFNTGITLDFFGWNQQWVGLMNRIYPPEAAQQPSAPTVVKQGPEPLADLDSDAREAVTLSDIMRAYYEINNKKTRATEQLYAGITRYAADRLYVPTLYSCETFSGVFDLWGQMLNQLGQYKKTVREMPGAYLFNPNFVSLPYAHALSQTGDDVQALAELRDYLIVRGGSALAYAEQGEILLIKGEFSEAAKALRSALELNPSDAKSHYDLAVALIQLNDKKSAIQQLNAAIQTGAGTNWAQLSQNILQSLQK
jgi:tetratricopeptide (TPR) repeat protein